MVGVLQLVSYESLDGKLCIVHLLSKALYACQVFVTFFEEDFYVLIYLYSLN